jgi:hypothetical protein
MNEPENKIPSEILKADDVEANKDTEFGTWKPPHYKFIPADIIDTALAEAALPQFVRKVRYNTVDIYEAVKDMKAARELKKSPGVHWPQLRLLLDSALAYSEWSALDDFATAWKKVEPKPCNVVYAGQDYPFSMLPDENDGGDSHPHGGFAIHRIPLLDLIGQRGTGSGGET